MSEVVKKPLKITETVLRDAHQSLIATRMTTEQMLPIIPKMDKVGFCRVLGWCDIRCLPEILKRGPMGSSS